MSSCARSAASVFTSGEVGGLAARGGAVRRVLDGAGGGRSALMAGGSLPGLAERGRGVEERAGGRGRASSARPTLSPRQPLSGTSTLGRVLKVGSTPLDTRTIRPTSDIAAGSSPPLDHNWAHNGRSTACDRRRPDGEHVAGLARPRSQARRRPRPRRLCPPRRVRHRPGLAPPPPVPGADRHRRAVRLGTPPCPLCTPSLRLDRSADLAHLDDTASSPSTCSPTARTTAPKTGPSST